MRQLYQTKAFYCRSGKKFGPNFMLQLPKPRFCVIPKRCLNRTKIYGENFFVPQFFFVVVNGTEM